MTPTRHPRPVLALLVLAACAEPRNPVSTTPAAVADSAITAPRARR
jgi:uncharacterized lipoprotein YajG